MESEGINDAQSDIAFLPSVLTKAIRYIYNFYKWWFGDQRMMRQWEYDTFFLSHDCRSEQKQKRVPQAVLRSRNRASFHACRRSMSSLSGVTTYPDTASSGSQSKWNHISISGTGMGRGTFCSRAWCHRRRVRCLWRYDAYYVLDSTKQYKVHWQD